MRYVIVWCASGSLTIRVDEAEFDMGPNSIITITSGQVHNIISHKKVRGMIVEFTYDFFCKNDRDMELVFHNSLFCHFAMNEVTDLKNSTLIGTELHSIKSELASKPYQYMISVHSRMELILVEINRSKLRKGKEIYKPDALFLKFLELVRASFKRNLTVSEIAEELGTSELRLNRLAKLHTGKTAQAVIYSLVASEAKRLFRYNKLTVKEAAFALGFNDPFYFSNFFKKHTRQSPKDYRAQFSDR
jgi:AraC family transcriptional regulator, transcriptional activator of pobA